MKEYISKNRIAYDLLAEQYQQRIQNASPYEEKIDCLGNFALKYVSNKQSIKVMEIGPGPGNMLAYFESKGCRTIGIELSYNMAKLCLQNSPNSFVVNANILEMNFYSKQFDLIYLGAVFHLFPKHDANILLEKIKRWLTPRGIVFINTTCEDSSVEGFSAKVDYTFNIVRFRKRWTESEFLDYLAEHNLQILDKMYTDEQDRKKRWLAVVCRVFQ